MGTKTEAFASFGVSFHTGDNSTKRPVIITDADSEVQSLIRISLPADMYFFGIKPFSTVCVQYSESNSVADVNAFIHDTFLFLFLSSLQQEEGWVRADLTRFMVIVLRFY
jgi:hypothetical protein